MVEIKLWNGEEKIEHALGNVAKARDWASERLGDNPAAFAWLHANIKDYTVVRTDGKGVMTIDSCGRDSWAALNQEVAMSEGIIVEHVNAATGEVVGIEQIIKASLDGLKIIQFTYTDKVGNVSERQAIVLDDKLQYAMRDDKGRVIKDAAGQPVMRRALNTVMSLRSEDRGYRSKAKGDRDDHTWDFRHPYMDMMENVVLVGDLTVNHPAIQLIARVKPAASKLADALK